MKMGKDDLLKAIHSEVIAQRGDIRELREEISMYKGMLTVIKWVGGGAIATLYGWMMVVSRKIGIFVY
jgi:hypothetical protein